MVEQHVGKKRRKEVREAINMKQELHKTLLMCSVVFGVAIIAIIIVTVLGVRGAFKDSNAFAQYVPLIICFVAIAAMSLRMVSYWNLRDKYKKHCKRFNISKDDMKALNRGEL